VETVDNSFRRNSDGGDEEFSAAVDDDVRKLTELSLRIIVAAKKSNLSNCIVIKGFGLGM
jgi:hypothetical protein